MRSSPRWDINYCSCSLFCTHVCELIIVWAAAMLLFFTLHAHIQTNILPPISHRAKGYWQDWHEYTLSQIHTTLTRHWYAHRHNSRTNVMWLLEVQRRTLICFKWRSQTDHERDLVCIFLDDHPDDMMLMLMLRHQQVKRQWEAVNVPDALWVE